MSREKSSEDWLSTLSIAFVSAAALGLPWLFNFDLWMLAGNVFVGLPLLVIVVTWLTLKALRPPKRNGVVFIAGAAVCSLTYLSLLVYGLTHGQKLTYDMRWLLFARSYRHQLETQVPVTGQLAHLDWDSSDFGDATFSYLVYDPGDTLSRLAVSRHRLPGIPCPVAVVHRMMEKFYIVVTFDNTSWSDCPAQTVGYK